MTTRGPARGATTAALFVCAALLLGACSGGAPGPSPSVARRSVGPPAATPLVNPPAAPAGDGTTATIETDKGSITLELFTRSSPVAAENFLNLAAAGFYEGVGFHRIVPGFVIQGGDPSGTGAGEPPYTIDDEPVVGDYVRGIVAMARTPAPHSQSTQFFICLDDLRGQLPKSGGYAIFGRVTAGMEVVDAIAAGPRGGANGQEALQPVLMKRVTVHRP